MLENFRFAYPQILWWLLGVPLMWLLTALWAFLYKRKVKAIGKVEIVQSLMPEASLGKKVWRNLLISFVVAFVILALARPQFGIGKTQTQAKGSEIALVVDVSNSMLARRHPADPSRLDKVKMAISRLINKLKNDRVSLIIFAGKAAMVVPMTDDYEALKLYVSSLKPNYISTQGTAISQALSLAIESFTPDPKINKAIILFSDGEDMLGKADDIAKVAKEKGIRIYTAGVGSPRGNPIFVNGKPMEYKGQVVISKQNPAYLKKLAAITSGAYVDITNRPGAIDYIYQEISKHATDIVPDFSKYNEVFDYFLGVAIVLLIFAILIIERKNRWLQKLKLFEPNTQ